MGFKQVLSSVPSVPTGWGLQTALSSPGGGAVSFGQLGLPGIEPAPVSLQSLVDAQREMVEAYERYDALRDLLFVGDDRVLPALLRRQAS